MIRSVLAVLAGLAAITIASFAIEAAANPLLIRMFPDTLPDQSALSRNLPASLFTLTYTLLCVVGGGYLTARLAGRFPVRHASVLGLLQAALMIPAMLEFRELAPLWRWILGMVLVIPAAWWGGVIYSRRALVPDRKHDLARRT